jgi:hypothetical protein
VHDFDKNLKVKNYFQDLIVDRKIMVNYISKKKNGCLWAVFFGLRIKTINGKDQGVRTF